MYVRVRAKKSILCALNVRRVCVSTCVFWIFLTLGIVNDENMLCTMWITCVCVYRQVVTQTHSISTFWVSAVLTLLTRVCMFVSDRKRRVQKGFAARWDLLLCPAAAKRFFSRWQWQVFPCGHYMD